MARRFLYLIAFGIVAVFLMLLSLRLFGERMSQVAFVPATPFVAPSGTNDYADPTRWIARPDMADDPSRFRPDGAGVDPAAPAYATFYVHPTSYIDRLRWNAPLDNPEANTRAAVFVRGQASVFARGSVWAPRYRQATFGAFLSTRPDARAAIEAAYGDVARAFDAFLAATPPGKPIVLAGHSQGALHLLRLLRERVAGQPVARRVVAVYAIGWPVGRASDLPALGLPACNAPDATRCIVSYQSFAEPAETGSIIDAFERQPGNARDGDRFVCTNPLTGSDGGTAPAAANPGTLKNVGDYAQGTLIAKAVPARCDARGFLLVGDPPDLGRYVLPGNNYHVYDYSLFWAALRADVARRARAFGA